MRRSRRRAEPDSAKIFPDLGRGASSAPCSHHLIPCLKYREFRPDPIDSAALYVARLCERSHFFRKVPVVFAVSRDFRGADRFSGSARPPPPSLRKRRWFPGPEDPSTLPCVTSASPRPRPRVLPL